ncbi:hypothetical protein [Arenibacter sp. ARW7G5Y1]|uniref:hypothetical protein n=1 Tax=Arenibacter sp. ARW7G5Y1 TaxID=2135619 RepID=UPI000D7622BC|nr:hypothetical protein [Arenibacter sp. ARW7G5Y1]PXX31216.1 hypothetical protein C7972_10151 [Arenibacter sp. ARW7G5Y1]
MYFKNITTAIFFIAQIIWASPKPCGCSGSNSDSFFTNGWSIVENDYSNSFKKVLWNNYGTKVKEDYEITGLRRHNLEFYDYGWLFEFSVLDQGTQKKIFVLNANMQSVLLTDAKKIAGFLLRNQPDLSTDKGLLEYWAMLTHMAELDNDPIHVLFSNEDLNSSCSTSNSSAPRVVYKDEHMARIQALVNIEGQVFSASYDLDYKIKNIVMKDAIPIIPVNSNTGCRPSYNKSEVSYSEWNPNSKSQVFSPQKYNVNH